MCIRDRHYSGEVEKFTLLCDKFTQGNMHQILSESVRFCRRYDKTFWCVFQFTVPIAVHLQNARTNFIRKCRAFFRWGGKRLHFCTINLLRIGCIKFYQNRSGFVEDITKAVWRFLVHSVHKFGIFVLSKFVVQKCKRFPPHLTNVSTLPCET